MQNKRQNNRTHTALREISIETNYIKGVASCLVKFGNTWVLCTASMDEKVPPFLRNQGSGWITAEYGMLPCATEKRTQREVIKGKQSGRTQEIQRLISRSLRACVDLKLIGERQIIIDCDVIQADGGTRVTSITGGYIALHIAIEQLRKRGVIRGQTPIIKQVAAISCGIINKSIFVDLDYNEDSNADVDANFVFASDDSIVEIQCCGEKATFQEKDTTVMLTLAKHACKEIMQKQKEAIISAGFAIF